MVQADKSEVDMLIGDMLIGDYPEILARIAEALQPEVYVELGVHKCITYNKILPYVRKDAYAVDIVDVRQFAKGGHVIQENTVDFAKRWNESIKQPIDFIFIDADHSKEAVAQDIENFLPWLRTDTGLMILHDVWPFTEKYVHPQWSGDGYLVMPALRKRSDIEVVTLPFLHGLGIIRKIGDNWRNGD